MNKPKEARNRLLFDLHQAHPRLSLDQLAEKLQYLEQVNTALPSRRLCRERVRQLLEFERKRRRAQLAQVK